ncbi:unnamed protein product [Ambrosiozyma monospora]|uniref:Unnamed protein product n=1 Tax=Ambrosiozyma monospora TaxID=43982 RepID=A0ACB5T743_AMBMO|nr:unnamed protein product [Ambrosiozyma monospora]
MLFSSTSPFSTLRKVICLLCLISIASAEKYLKSSSLLTCSSDSQFSTSFFDVVFYPDNKTVVYQIDGTSLITGKVNARLDVIVYGLNVYNDKISFCDLGYSQLCPISSGHMTLDSTYQIESDMINKVPGIAYTIPDLDAYAQVQVYYDDDTNYENPIACVQAVLTNGRTVQTLYAGWPIACISGFGLVVSAFVSILGHSATAAHIASNASSLFVYFQFLAITSMMGVARVPPIAAAWAQNFQWSIGIIKAKFMQTMIYWYVQATGGDVTSTLANKSVISISVQKMKEKLKFLKRGISVVTTAAADVLDNSDLYTTDETNVGSKTLVLRGVQRVAYLSNIEISNMFMTGIIFFLFVGFILIFVTFLFKGICELLVLAKALPETKLAVFRSHWRSIVKGSLFRLINITFPQITLLCLWEFTRNDSAGCMNYFHRKKIHK